MLDAAFLEQLNKKYSHNSAERIGYASGNQLIEFENIHPEPIRGFEVGPEDLEKMEADKDAWAIWHTQPSKTSQLSYEDYVGFINFPEYHHIVVGMDGVRVYRVENGAVVKNGMYLNA